MSIIQNENYPGHLQHRPGMIPLKDSTNSAKNLHNFVNIKKTKSLSKNMNTELGYEYHHDVINDHDYYQKIFTTNAYSQLGKMPMEISLISNEKALTNRKTDDLSKSSEEQVQSITNLSIVPAPMTGSLTTKELEASLGKYATKKLGKKTKSKDGIWQEEFYIVKMKWLVKLAKVQSETHKYNLNNFRITIEKIIEEAAPAFEMNLFQHQKKVAKGLKKLSHFLAKLDPQKAILLSYKLFKIHLKQLDITQPQVKQEIAVKFHNFFLPYIKLMEIKEIHPKEKTQKKRSNLMTYKKIKKFSQKHSIIAILTEYPDPKKTPEFAEKFKGFLRERVSLEQALSELTIRTLRLLKPIFSPPLPLENNNPIIIDRSLLESNSMRRALSGLDQPSHHHVERKRSDTSFEDAKSFELSEDQSNNKFGLECYNFSQKLDKQNPKLLKGKSANPNEIIDRSDDSSGDNSKTESELMEDPDLYQPNLQHAESEKRGQNYNCDDLDMLTGAENMLPKLRLEGTTSVISPNEAVQRGNIHHHQKVNHFREPMFCSDDANIAADPQRVSERPEIMRLNSYDNVVPFEAMVASQGNQENLTISPAQPHHHNQNNHDSHPLQSRRKSSLCRKSLSMSKTKKEILFQKVLSIAYDNVSKWEKVIDNNLIKIEKIKPENSPVVLLRAWATIEGFTPNEVFEQIFNTDKRCKWDNVTAYMTTVETIDEHSDIIHFVIKTPFGITERDFLQRRDVIMDYPEPGTITMSFQSCLHPAKPPTKNRIRGETHIAGYIIKPSLTSPGSTELCVLTQCDIKGKVPKTIVNMVASRAPADWVNKLKKACEKSRQEGA